MTIKTTETVVSELTAKFGNTLEYSKIEYINVKTPIILTCPSHGDFKTLPTNFKRFKGCPYCLRTKLHITDLINQMNAVHNFKYNYEKETFTTVNKPMTIICKQHGPFFQKPHVHLQGYGCRKCSSWSIEDAIKEAHKVHNNRYTYDSSMPLKTIEDNVTIFCKEHGKFSQIMRNHLRGQNCPACSKKKRYTLEEFINQANEIHNFKYDYSLISEFKNKSEKVEILCKEHGSFWQKGSHHTTDRQGCPECSKETTTIFRKSGFIEACERNSNKGIFYLIKCYNSNESFYKLGITSKTIKQRHQKGKDMPYDYEVILELEGEPNLIWELELKNKQMIRDALYTPLIPFRGGLSECFTDDQLLKIIIDHCDLK